MPNKTAIYTSVYALRGRLRPAVYALRGHLRPVWPSTPYFQTTPYVRLRPSTPVYSTSVYALRPSPPHPYVRLRPASTPCVAVYALRGRLRLTHYVYDIDIDTEGLKEGGWGSHFTFLNQISASHASQFTHQ